MYCMGRLDTYGVSLTKEKLDPLKLKNLQEYLVSLQKEKVSSSSTFKSNMGKLHKICPNSYREKLQE